MGGGATTKMAQAIKSVVPKTGNLLETSFGSVITPAMLATFGASGFLLWVVKRTFNVAPPTLDKDWMAESAKIGNVVERTSAPPLYRNPIRLGIPGNVRGPEDLQELENS